MRGEREREMVRWMARGCWAETDFHGIHKNSVDNEINRPGLKLCQPEKSSTMNIQWADLVAQASNESSWCMTLWLQSSLNYTCLLATAAKWSSRGQWLPG